MDSDACSRPGAERIRKFLPNLSRPIDVGLKANGSLSLVNRGQHRRKDLIAVQQPHNTVSGNERRAQELSHDVQKLGILNAVAGADVVFQVLLAGGEIQREQRDPHRDRDGDQDQEQRVHIGSNLLR